MINRIVTLQNHIQNRAVRELMKLRNRPVNRHIVVFESDDWGSIRMPSIKALNSLIKRGVRFSETGLLYDRVDTLASNDDLECLMSVLSSVRDANGNPAILTLNCVTANPDFDRIRESGFKQYFYEPFPETLKKYPNHNRSFDLWKEGIACKVFKPQFHGREHLNVMKWMRLLQAGNEDVISAFDAGTYSMQVDIGGIPNFVVESFDALTQDDVLCISKSIEEGLSLFEKLFGFRSQTMIAPCFKWDPFVEDAAFRCGVIGIQGGYIQQHSCMERAMGNRITGHYFGEINGNGQVYMVRNCSFEPSQGAFFNSDRCMVEITRAFRCKLPAVVSCHRLNFIGGHDAANRDSNLRDFGKLLRTMVDQYPDVEFMSSDELAYFYRNENHR